MKIKVVEAAEDFSPVDVVIRVESKEELVALYSLGNCSADIVGALPTESKSISKLVIEHYSKEAIEVVLKKLFDALFPLV